MTALSPLSLTAVPTATAAPTSIPMVRMDYSKVEKVGVSSNSSSQEKTKGKPSLSDTIERLKGKLGCGSEEGENGRAGATIVGPSASLLPINVSLKWFCSLAFDLLWLFQSY